MAMIDLEILLIGKTFTLSRRNDRFYNRMFSKKMALYMFNFYSATESKEAQENIPKTTMIRILTSELQEVHREKN